MPQREETLIGAELSDPLDFLQIERNQMNGLPNASAKLGMSFHSEHTPEFSRTPKLAEPAFQPDRREVPPGAESRAFNMDCALLE